MFDRSLISITICGLGMCQGLGTKSGYIMMKRYRRAEPSSYSPKKESELKKHSRSILQTPLNIHKTTSLGRTRNNRRTPQLINTGIGSSFLHTPFHQSEWIQFIHIPHTRMTKKKPMAGTMIAAKKKDCVQKNNYPTRTQSTFSTSQPPSEACRTPSLKYS